MLSTPEELEQLQNTRARMEDEHRSLEEQQKNLELRTKILEERIAIEQLKSGNKSKNEAINQLKIKLDGLEQRLNGMVSDTLTSPIEPEQRPETTEVTSHETEAVSVVSEAPAEEIEEDNVTVAALENPTPQEQEQVGIFNKQHEKKKRKLFY
jgi:hypothetical protein